MNMEHGTCCLGARVFLGLGYVGVSWAELLGAGTSPSHAEHIWHRSIGLEFQTSVLMLMLAVIGSWMILGIRTRVIALLGLALMIAFAWSNQYLPGSLPWVIYATSATVMTVPLALHGGGRFALARGGWRGLT